MVIDKKSSTTLIYLEKKDQYDLRSGYNRRWYKVTCIIVDAYGLLHAQGHRISRLGRVTRAVRVIDIPRRTVQALHCPDHVQQEVLKQMLART